MRGFIISKDKLYLGLLKSLIYTPTASQIDNKQLRDIYKIVWQFDDVGISCTITNLKRRSHVTGCRSNTICSNSSCSCSY